MATISKKFQWLQEEIHLLYKSGTGEYDGDDLNWFELVGQTSAPLSLDASISFWACTLNFQISQNMLRNVRHTLGWLSQVLVAVYCYISIYLYSKGIWTSTAKVQDQKVMKDRTHHGGTVLVPGLLQILMYQITEKLRLHSAIISSKLDLFIPWYWGTKRIYIESCCISITKSLINHFGLYLCLLEIMRAWHGCQQNNIPDVDHILHISWLTCLLVAVNRFVNWVISCSWWRSTSWAEKQYVRVQDVEPPQKKPPRLFVLLWNAFILCINHL